MLCLNSLLIHYRDASKPSLRLVPKPSSVRTHTEKTAAMDNMSKILESLAHLDLDAAAAAIEECRGSGSFSVICSSLSFEVTLALCIEELGQDAQAFEAFIDEIFRD